MKITKDAVVKMHFSVMDDEQNTIDNTYDGEPLEIIAGHGYLVEGLEAAIADKQAGDTFSVTVTPEQGYGERHDELTQVVEKSMFDGMDIDVGMQFRATTDDGERTVIIIGIEGDEVVIDGNHPLSGLTLKFDVEIVHVREATADELEHGHVHGAGGCGHEH